MIELNEFNKYILQRYNLLEEKDELSMPLLVSSDNSYINGFNKKVFYIGQETNCWLNYSKNSEEINLNEIEKEYLFFLRDRGASNKDFWRFIRDCLSISKGDLSKNLIWSNTFICGKRREIGSPKPMGDLLELSVQYLIYLYNYFRPEYTIIVNGPKNPYYTITKQFLNTIKSNISNYPTLDDPLIIDDIKNIFWTYHPNYQNRSGMKQYVIEKIKSNIKK